MSQFLLPTEESLPNSSSEPSKMQSAGAKVFEIAEDEKPDLFAVLEERKRRGQWKGQVDRHEVKEYTLSGGQHYYEMESLAKRSIVCTSCPIKHGGILEAHLLGLYELKEGVLYFKGKGINETPGS